MRVLKAEISRIGILSVGFEVLAAVMKNYIFLGY
jgi:hypothetical protein